MIVEDPTRFQDIESFFNSPQCRAIGERERLRQRIEYEQEQAKKVFEARSAGENEYHYFLEGVVAYAKLRCGIDLTPEEISAIAEAAYAGLDREPEGLDPIVITRKLQRFRENRPTLRREDFQKRFAKAVEDLPD
jgi:hypothetical protein